MMVLLNPPRDVDVTNRRKYQGDFPPGAVFEARDWLREKASDSSALVWDGPSQGEGASTPIATPPPVVDHSVFVPGTRFRVEQLVDKRGAFDSGFFIWARVLNGPRAGDRVNLNPLSGRDLYGPTTGRPVLTHNRALIRVE